MEYTVKYKRFLFWKKIESIVADGYVEDRNVRFFILKDNTRIEISADNTIFIFSPKREEAIKEGQDKVN